jgi:hypothetical protein
MSGIPPLQSEPSSASMTQLPPSPELKAGSTQPLMGPEFSLDASSQASCVIAPPSPGTSGVIPFTTTTRRLRSVARYQAFHPRALACSNTLTSYDEDAANTSSFKTDLGPSSLGAVGGPQGVALFRLSRPHVPLLILSHATNSSSKNSISSLAFQPKSSPSAKSPSNSLYLAATRGSGVFIWDASGHCPNPLIGRLGMDHANGNGTPANNNADMDTSRITSIAWKPSKNASPLLATATSSSFSMWDLRSAPAAFRPTLRFGAIRKASPSSSPLVQVACASEDSEECATIDTTGVVRVYDIRMTERTQYGTPVSTFVAHETAGVGISYFGPSTTTGGDNHNSSKSTTSSRWLSWGLDTPLSSAVIKVWTKDAQLQPTADSDTYWYIPDTGSPRQGTNRLTSGLTQDYHMKARCARPNLACARVAAAPVENSFMAIGHLPSDARKANNSEGGWWAELFSLGDEEEKPKGEILSLKRTFGLTKVAGFQGGTSTIGADKKALVSLLGSRTDLGRLQAAEIAFSGVKDEQEEDKDEVELILCCLSETGVVTTHVSTCPEIPYYWQVASPEN